MTSKRTDVPAIRMRSTKLVISPTPERGTVMRRTLEEIMDPRATSGRVVAPAMERVSAQRRRFQLERELQDLRGTSRRLLKQQEELRAVVDAQSRTIAAGIEGLKLLLSPHLARTRTDGTLPTEQPKEPSPMKSYKATAAVRQPHEAHREWSVATPGLMNEESFQRFSKHIETEIARVSSMSCEEAREMIRERGYPVHEDDSAEIEQPARSK